MTQVVCEITGKAFEVSSQEADAYRHFALPLPKLSPPERFRRQLAFAHGPRFFWRSCSVTKERIFSCFTSRATFPVVSSAYWESSEFDAAEFGTPYSSARNFFEQLYDLWKVVPRPAVIARRTRNCEAVCGVSDAENCFFVLNSSKTSNSFYSLQLNDCKYCCDCYSASQCEKCYECIDCLRCKHLIWSSHCIDCSDSRFLFNCSACTNCLFCANLEGKSFCVFNKQLSSDEYREVLKSWDLRNRSRLESAMEEFADFIRGQVVPHIYCDDVSSNSGNYLWKSVRTIDSFHCQESANLLYCHALNGAKSCLDGYGFGNGIEDCAQFVGVGDRARFVFNSFACADDIENLAYCAYCSGSSNLLGCVGLKGKQFCILNRQYTERDYRKLYDQIKSQLLSAGVWGAYLPPVFSDHPYNLSAASMFMPLNKIQVDLLRYPYDTESDILRPTDLIMHNGQDLSDRFSDVPETPEELSNINLNEKLFLCEMSGRPFRITQAEYNLYQELGIPLPRSDFFERQRVRMSKCSPFTFYVRKSSKSSRDIRTAFPPTWPNPVVDYNEWQSLVNFQSR